MQDYETLRKDFSLALPERFNFARDVLDKWAEDSRLTAIWWLSGETELRISYRNLAQASCRCAHVLSGNGIKPGDTLVVMLGRNYQWWQVFSACLRMGVVVAPATAQLSQQDLRYRIRLSGARGVITDLEHAAKIDAIYADSEELDLRLLVGGARPGWVDYDAAM